MPVCLEWPSGPLVGPLPTVGTHLATRATVYRKTVTFEVESNDTIEDVNANIQDSHTFAPMHLHPEGLTHNE